ncbi:uncharacterized protein LOC135811853 isoform X2 [Sycon ciliatum]|uniref:uncharacterized protein LOC135811853 isoform X2 n=1 Tax=Sycon ciliatum TaxID=27933 RepID=UPI0020AB3AB2
MMEAVATSDPTESEQIGAEETVEEGIDEAAAQEQLDEEYRKKKDRLDLLEGEARDLRITLATKEREIDLLREELCLTPSAQLKRTVENSTLYQKTSSTLSTAGHATASAVGSAANKTGEALTKVSTSVKESQTWQDLGARWRSASQSMKDKFSQQRSYSESSQNHEAEESQSYSNTPS